MSRNGNEESHIMLSAVRTTSTSLLAPVYDAFNVSKQQENKLTGRRDAASRYQFLDELLFKIVVSTYQRKSQQTRLKRLLCRTKDKEQLSRPAALGRQMKYKFVRPVHVPVVAFAHAMIGGNEAHSNWRNCLNRVPPAITLLCPGLCVGASGYTWHFP